MYVVANNAGEYVRIDPATTRAVLIPEKGKAQVFQTRVKAENFVRSNLKKRGTFKVIEYTESKPEGGIYNDVIKRGSELRDKIGEADRKISDMYHYMEINDLSASEGYKAYKNLQIILRERRNIKNEMDTLSRVQRIMEEDAAIKKVYKPREMYGLFGKAKNNYE